jgi:hypothetical protein
MFSTSRASFSTFSNYTKAEDEKSVRVFVVEMSEVAKKKYKNYKKNIKIKVLLEFSIHNNLKSSGRKMQNK